MLDRVEHDTPQLQRFRQLLPYKPFRLWPLWNRLFLGQAESLSAPTSSASIIITVSHPFVACSACAFSLGSGSFPPEVIPALAPQFPFSSGELGIFAGFSRTARVESGGIAQCREHPKPSYSTLGCDHWPTSELQSAIINFANRNRERHRYDPMIEWTAGVVHKVNCLPETGMRLGLAFGDTPFENMSFPSGDATGAYGGGMNRDIIRQCLDGDSCAQERTGSRDISQDGSDATGPLSPANCRDGFGSDSQHRPFCR